MILDQCRDGRRCAACAVPLPEPHAGSPALCQRCAAIFDAPPRYPQRRLMSQAEREAHNFERNRRRRAERERVEASSD